MELPVNIFVDRDGRESDDYRRAAAQFTRPKTVIEAASTMARFDPSVVAEFYTVDGLQPVVDHLIDEGLLVNLGQPSSPEELVAATDEDGRRTMPEEEREAFIARTNNPYKVFPRLDAGDHYVLSDEGYTRLCGLAPQSDPAVAQARHPSTRSVKQQQELDAAIAHWTPPSERTDEHRKALAEAADRAEEKLPPGDRAAFRENYEEHWG